MSELTVDEAINQRSQMRGETKHLHDVIECCLNAEAALSMMGHKRPMDTTGFLPVGVLTLVQVQDVLARMPQETALVRASMAFGCELCGKPAQTGNEDCWFCTACVESMEAADHGR